MKLPFICPSCGKDEDHEVDQYTMDCICGGTMEIHYEDNYEEDHDNAQCNGCLYLRVGNGEKCNYCNRI